MKTTIKFDAILVIRDNQALVWLRPHGLRQAAMIAQYRELGSEGGSRVFAMDADDRVLGVGHDGDVVRLSANRADVMRAAGIKTYDIVDSI